MIVKYISSSAKQFVLNQNHEIAIKECNPHTTKWNYESIEQQFGVKVTSFKKEPIQLQIIFKFKGDLITINQNMNEFFEECEKDIISKNQGSLIFGNEYIRGWFIERDTKPSKTFYGYELTAIFFSPHPFYIKEMSKDFFPGGSDMATSGLDYPYDYLYDYTINTAGTDEWNINHFASSDFQMIIYGPCVNPRILINAYPYEIGEDVENREYIIINSRENTVKKYSANGIVTDVFYKRNTDNTVFKKIPPGRNTINWSGTFGFNITLYLERSEPKWN